MGNTESPCTKLGSIYGLGSIMTTDTVPRDTMYKSLPVRNNEDVYFKSLNQVKTKHRNKVIKPNQ